VICCHALQTPPCFLVLRRCRQRDLSLVQTIRVACVEQQVQLLLRQLLLTSLQRMIDAMEVVAMRRGSEIPSSVIDNSVRGLFLLAYQVINYSVTSLTHSDTQTLRHSHPHAHSFAQKLIHSKLTHIAHSLTHITLSHSLTHSTRSLTH
jgi:hypothetical protein